MKKMLVIGAMLLVGAVANADTVCVTQGLSDQGTPLYTATFKSHGQYPAELIVETNGQILEDVPAGMFMTQVNSVWYSAAFGTKYALSITLDNESVGYLRDLVVKKDFPVTCSSK